MQHFTPGNIQSFELLMAILVFSNYNCIYKRTSSYCDWWNGIFLVHFWMDLKLLCVYTSAIHVWIVVVFWMYAEMCHRWSCTVLDECLSHLLHDFVDFLSLIATDWFLYFDFLSITTYPTNLCPCLLLNHASAHFQICFLLIG